MFNPHPRVQVVPLFDGHHCLVVDDVLQEPQRWVDFALNNWAHFSHSGYAYPGHELWLAEGATAQTADFFAQHVRGRLGARRTLELSVRLSVVSQAPASLLPRQRLCHRDLVGVPPGQCMVASVIYLFADPTLGGTSFFRPLRSAQETETITRDAREMGIAAFEAAYPDVARGYMVDSNPWFERVATVPAAWNRAVFYNGGLYHSGDIRAPQRMLAQPAQGRLTMNGFMLCRLNAA